MKKSENNFMERNVLIVVAPEGFRDEEYFEPKKVLEDKGFDVVTASVGRVSKAIGKLGGETDVDIDITEVNPEDFQAIVFVGGPGAKVFQKDDQVHDIIRTFYYGGKLIGAICIAPIILAYAGILEGRNATVWNEDGTSSSIIEDNGGNYVDIEVVRDGNIITANGPEAAKEFAEKISVFFEKVAVE